MTLASFAALTEVRQRLIARNSDDPDSARQYARPNLIRIAPADAPAALMALGDSGLHSSESDQ